ncbi:MAG: metallophosphoesterase family protein [Candidatus Cyclobacteriaceae bacterium M3_2C_046]
MKRRNFLQNCGLGVSSGYLGKSILNRKLWPLDYPYQSPISSIAEALSAEGLLLVRLALSGNDPEQAQQFISKIKVKNARIDRIKSFYFESGEDQLDLKTHSMVGSTPEKDEDIVVLWLENASENTVLQLQINNQDHQITLPQLLDQPEVQIGLGHAMLTVNLLFDKEIGEIDISRLGIDPNQNSFRFAIFADPQGGDPQAPRTESPTRMKIHNAFIEESVATANSLDPQLAFSVVLGDFVDSKGQEGHYEQMIDFFKNLKSPYLLEVGNHETAYSAKFSPGYYMGDMKNFFSAQHHVNGINKILYSFNLGQWHFIVWPDPLRSEFWPRHPHYFDWLEGDLEKYKDKPTIFLQHIPIHPIGINPLVNYAESVEVKGRLLDILSKNGNVKYVFSGHVHIPIKASVKTAVSYKGINFINLPAAGYRPRAFGEEDFFGGPSQGIAIVDIADQDINLQFKTVTNQVYQYPDKFPLFQPENYPLWLHHKWELTANSSLKNGSFENKLSDWVQRYVYQEDENPSNVCKVVQRVGFKQSSALYLYNRKRDYDIPGQDRMPQTLNRICQVVTAEAGKFPVVQVRYKVDALHSTLNSLNGGYIWMEGFSGSWKRLNLVYSAGTIYGNIGGRYSQIGQISPVHFNIPEKTDDWGLLTINLAWDHNQHHPDQSYERLNLDKLVINLGVWTINDGFNQRYAVWFDEVSLDWTENLPAAPSSIDTMRLDEKNEGQIYYFRNDHTAGEHQYADNDQIYQDL